MDRDLMILQLEDIMFQYPGGDPILKNLNLEFREGDRLGLVGPNGSGKTTLFHVIVGLLKPTSGKMKIFGKPVSQEKDFWEVRRRIGFLFQDPDDQLFSPTVLEDVAFGPLNQGKSREEALSISNKTLESLGLSGFEDRVTHKLSGGEKRLVSLATILAMEPKVLLLDEPSNGLDEKTRETLIQVLSSLELSYILISHEADFLARTTSAVSKMEDGRILADYEAQLHYHLHEHPQGKFPHRHDEQHF